MSDRLVELLRKDLPEGSPVMSDLVAKAMKHATELEISADDVHVAVLTAVQTVMTEASAAAPAAAAAAPEGEAAKPKKAKKAAKEPLSAREVARAAARDLERVSATSLFRRVPDAATFLESVSRALLGLLPEDFVPKGEEAEEPKEPKPEAEAKDEDDEDEDEDDEEQRAEEAMRAVRGWTRSVARGFDTAVTRAASIAEAVQAEISAAKLDPTPSEVFARAFGALGDEPSALEQLAATMAARDVIKAVAAKADPSGDEAVLAVEKVAAAAAKAGDSPNLVDLSLAALDSLINSGLRAGKELRSIDVDRVLAVLRRVSERQVLAEHVRASISTALESPVTRDLLAFMKGRIERSLANASTRIERGNRKIAAGGGIMGMFRARSCVPCGKKKKGSRK